MHHILDEESSPTITAKIAHILGAQQLEERVGRKYPSIWAPQKSPVVILPIHSAEVDEGGNTVAAEGEDTAEGIVIFIMVVMLAAGRAMRTPLPYWCSLHPPLTPGADSSRSSEFHEEKDIATSSLHPSDHIHP